MCSFMLVCPTTKHPAPPPRNWNWEMQTEHYNVGMRGPFCLIIQNTVIPTGKNVQDTKGALQLSLWPFLGTFFGHVNTEKSERYRWANSGCYIRQTAIKMTNCPLFTVKYPHKISRRSVQQLSTDVCPHGEVKSCVFATSLRRLQ